MSACCVWISADMQFRKNDMKVGFLSGSSLH